ARQAGDERGEREPAPLDQPHQQAEGGLQSGDAGRGCADLAFLVHAGMRGVVGGDAVDDAQPQRFGQGVGVLLGAQGWVDPATRRSCITVPRISSPSSQWSTIGRSTSREYSSAWRISRLDATGWPSSEKATAPAAAMSAISLNSWPRCPLLMVPIGQTRARAS